MVQVHLGPPFTGGVAQSGERRLCKAEVIGSIPFTSTSLAFLFFENRGKVVDGSRHKGHMVDALASESEEGRGRLRKAPGSCERAKIRGYPNGGTQLGSYPVTAW